MSAEEPIKLRERVGSGEVLITENVPDHRQNHGGPGDDVTGPVATTFAVLAMVIFLAAAALSWLTRRAWRRSRSGNDLNL